MSSGMVSGAASGAASGIDPGVSSRLSGGNSCFESPAIFLRLILGLVISLIFNSSVYAETAPANTRGSLPQQVSQVSSPTPTSNRTRISRPASLPAGTSKNLCELGSAGTVTGKGDSTQFGNAQNQFQNKFQSIVPGISYRWWRKFKNPSFCPYVICGSSCADISGIPRIGSYSMEELISTQTPCGLTELNALAKPDSCCISGTVDSTYRKDSANLDSCKSNCSSNHTETCH